MLLQCTTAVPGVKGKKKRVRTEDEEEGLLSQMGEEENISPNRSPDKAKPQRKVRGHARGGHTSFLEEGTTLRLREQVRDGVRERH